MTTKIRNRASHTEAQALFFMVSDIGSPTTLLRASTSDTFEQDRTDLLNNNHRVGHILIKRARLLNIDSITQPPSIMPDI